MGKKGSSTQTTENKPPKWSEPLFASSASEAQRIYSSGAGGNVYRGETVAGLGNTTKQGIAGVTSAAGSLPKTTAAQNYLTDYANGTYLKQGNPYFNDAIQGQLDDTAAQVMSQFSGSGRYGSGANTGVLANKLGSIRSNALADQFSRDQANQLAATGMIDNANSNLYQNRLTGQQAVINAGQLEDQARQAKLTADFTKWQSEDMRPWTRLGLLQSAAAGSAGNYGTNTQTVTQPFNALQGIGALGSLFTKSDARLKTHIKPVGVKNGHVIYEWQYAGTRTRFRGVMAQDVIEFMPSAVIVHNGYYAVNYGMLGLEMEAA